MRAEQQIRTGDYTFIDVYEAREEASCIVYGPDGWSNSKIKIRIRSIDKGSPSPCKQEETVCDSVEKKSIRQLLEDLNKAMNVLISELRDIRKILDKAQ